MDSQRFDDLARSLGGGVSRRRLLGGLAASAVAVVFGQAGIREVEGEACGIVSTFSSFEELEACPSVVQRVPAGTNHICDVPVLNQVKPDPVPGGGKATAWGLIRSTFARAVGGARDRNFLADFVPACEQHDICFGTCGTTKQSCNDKFGLDLTEACAKAYWWSPGLLAQCQVQATEYYAVVSLFGPFEAEQLKFCGCCHDQECFDQGGHVCGDTCVECASGEYFDEASCRCFPQCPPAQHLCGDTCVDLLNNENNCGECGIVCESGVCEFGQCTTDSANTCDVGGSCASPSYCGDNGECNCFQTTEGDAFCHASQSCNASLTCDSSQDCTDPNYPVCSKVTCCGEGVGVCIQPCLGAPGFAAARVSSDEPTTTSRGVQEPECDPGMELCNGLCVEVLTDIANCGGCGVVCVEDQTCEAGLCVDAAPPPADDIEPVVECDSGLTSCGDLCVDLAVDPANCGDCGVVCAESELCEGGACMPPATNPSNDDPVAGATPT